MNIARSFGKAILFAIWGMAIMFFAGTFIGIVTLATIGAVRHVQVDLTIAYRIIGLSTAAMGFFAGFMFGFIRDLRRH